MSRPVTAAPERPVHAPPPRPAGGGPFGRGPMGGMGMPAEKAMTFKPSAQRLLRRLAPAAREGGRRPRARRPSASRFAVAGPKLLGQATDIIFAGVLGRRLPAGITTQQAADAARAAGPRQHRRPAAAAPASSRARASTSARSATVLLWAVALYVAASVFSWLQGYLLNDVVQRTVLPAAVRRRGQAAPAAAAVLRHAARAASC